jgi:hypothetical protein
MIFLFFIVLLQNMKDYSMLLPCKHAIYSKALYIFILEASLYQLFFPPAAALRERGRQREKQRKLEAVLQQTIMWWGRGAAVRWEGVCGVKYKDII